VKISLVASYASCWSLIESRRHHDHTARSSYERFALPHTFKPQLSLAEAAISAAGAFLRILFGSMLFAVWGTYTFYAWSSIRNVFLRGGAVLALLLLFAVSFTFLMLAISALLRSAWHAPPRP